MVTLVTGCAGFIGFHVAQALLARGEAVVGIDDLNAYYDPALKRARLALLQQPAFQMTVGDVADPQTMTALFARHRPERVIHLAAQAGVRYSLENPRAYARSNLLGFTEVLEGCRQVGCGHLVYASTSSVYGANRKLPFVESDSADHPLQYYAATKRANELMAHSYSQLFGLPTSGLRFFTVYGPWGRPDMALFSFTRKILAGEPIELFNGGNHSRDFTYVDDIVAGILAVSDRPAQPDLDWSALAPQPNSSSAPFQIFNIGNSNPVSLIDYVEALEAALGQRAVRRLLPLQPGDVADTYADSRALAAYGGVTPRTSVAEGVARFVAWYRDFYRL